MLLCLDRTQGLVFILGDIFEASSAVGAETLEISHESFRRTLSRSHKQLDNFMHKKCSLMNPDNPCNCARKTRTAIVVGYVDPQRLKFHQAHIENVKTLVAS